MQPTREFNKADRFVTLCLFASACFSAYFASRSLLMASRDTSLLPLGDIWWFYRDYFSYIDGTYSFRHLFDRHNEHVIATTRLALFVDVIWFKASGKFALLVAYGSAAGTGLILSWLAARPNKTATAGLTVAFLGMTWAFIQLDNLTLPFQEMFPLAHALALVTLVSLNRGLKGDRRWYALGFVTDFLLVFTLGSGVLLGASAVALAIWRRNIDRVFVGFMAFHASLIGLFAWLTSGPGLPEGAGLPTLREAAVYFTMFLGNFAFEPAWTVHVGKIIVVLCASLFSFLTWRAVSRAPRPPDEILVLAAFALFITLEAAGATYARAHFGPIQALSLRYTTCTLLLAATLAATLWRLFPRSPTRVATVLALAAVVHVANPAAAELGWRKRNQDMDAIAAEISKGRLPPNAYKELFIREDIFEPLIWRFRAARLGPFVNPEP